MKSKAWTEKFMQGVFFVAACASVLAVALICIFLFANGIPAIKEIGFVKFITGEMWRPSNELFGIFPMIIGSLYVTAGAVIIGVPDAEIAYCSLHDTVKTFRYMWDGMMQGKSVDEGWIQKGNKKTNEHRIHPTQKPIDLYRWIAREYIKPGWNVLDTHTGSASSLIAYHEAGIRYVGFEINEKMYQKARKRLKEVENQLSIFDLGVKR